VNDPLRSPLALGGGGFGGQGSPPELIGSGLDDAGASKVLTRALNLGMTLIDTAHSYAGGESERMIGSWLAANPGRRNHVALVDKLGVMVGDGGLRVDLSTASVHRCAAQSRARMGIERVDVVMSHGPDSDTAVETTLRAFGELIEAGYAAHYGVSNVELSDLQAWLAAADRLGLPPPLLVENEYNLLRRDDETTVLPLCAEREIGYLAYSPLAAGVLTGKYRPGQAPPVGSQLALRPELNDHLLHSATFAAVDRLAAYAAARAMSTAAISLAWVAAQPNVRPIVGISHLQQLDAAEQTLARPLSLDEASEVADLFRDPH
jgi:aryl-alcohol dehydrogenase-like predicted oxidoreductase